MANNKVDEETTIKELIVSVLQPDEILIEFVKSISANRGYLSPTILVLSSSRFFLINRIDGDSRLAITTVYFSAIKFIRWSGLWSILKLNMTPEITWDYSIYGRNWKTRAKHLAELVTA